MNIYCIRNSVASIPKRELKSAGNYVLVTQYVEYIEWMEIICGKWNDTFIMSIS